MDPQAAWEAMIQSLIDNDVSSASDFADALTEWLARGGFPPTALPQVGQSACSLDSLARQLDRMIVDFVCARVRTGK